MIHAKQVLSVKSFAPRPGGARCHLFLTSDHHAKASNRRGKIAPYITPPSSSVDRFLPRGPGNRIMGIFVADEVAQLLD